MIQIPEQTKDNVIATKATGKLTKADYDKLMPLLNKVVRQHEKIRWYFEMGSFDGWELKPFLEDVKFDIKHANDFEKIAMVGEKQWEKWMTEGMKPFTSAEVRIFDISQKDEALQWIKK